MELDFAVVWVPFVEREYKFEIWNFALNSLKGKLEKFHEMNAVIFHTMNGIDIFVQFEDCWIWKLMKRKTVIEIGNQKDCVYLHLQSKTADALSFLKSEFELNG